MKTLLMLAAGSALALTLAGCGSSAPEKAAPKPSGSASSASPGAASASPSTSRDEVAAFQVDAMCKAIDRSLVKKITGPVLGRDVSLKQGERAPMSGAPVQGPTCSLEGGKGQVEAAVFSEPSAVARRKAFVAQGDCKPVERAPWDKAFECTNGPILIRYGKDSVFTCYSGQEPATPQSNTLGRAICDDLLGKIS